MNKYYYLSIGMVFLMGVNEYIEVDEKETFADFESYTPNILEICSQEDAKYGMNFRLVVDEARKQKRLVDSLAARISNKKKAAFVRQNGVWAIEEAVLWGILPSGKMAQGALESGWGSGTIARKGNNYFCIKGRRGFKHKDDEYLCKNTGKRWHGKTHPKRCKSSGHEHILEMSTFLIFPSPWRSWRYHSEFLFKNPRRYKKTRQSLTYHEYCRNIQGSGYATDPSYGNKLKDIIEDSNLDVLDEIVMSNRILKEAFHISRKRSF